ncbi:MAG TPA: DUF302 domain-containing protein [Anaerolineaceae bacterium]|nr:DUF302 domain-containing protein [Anaerolineaceae bacterium]
MAFTVILSTSFDEALERVTTALKGEGFGVLASVDIQETLKKKLDVDVRPYHILGACNPSLAHRALEADARVGLLLPCNVTLEGMGDGTVRVSFLNPEVALTVGDLAENAEVHAIAAEARQRYGERAARALAEQGA